MTDRIQYLDTIKGFTIILVILAHSIAWNYEDWNIALSHRSFAPMIWWRIIYSFHMPLFFCVSGYLSNVTKENIYIFIKKRSQGLLIPFISFFLINTLFIGKITDGPWFLRTLFLFTIINALSSYISKNFYNRIFLTILIFTIINRAISLSNNIIINKIFDLEHLSFFNFLGYLTGLYLRNNQKFETIINKEISLTISILCYVLLFILQLHSINFPFCGYLYYTIPFFAIIIFWHLFKIKLTNERFNRVFSYIGKYSLHIYLIHTFFRLRLLNIGEHILLLANNNDYSYSCTVSTESLFVGIVTSFVTLFLSLISIKLIEKSKLLNFVLFGKR